MKLLVFSLILIIIVNIETQEILKIGKTNTLKDKNQYKCILPIKEIKKSKKDIKYIIFDFPNEKKNKRNEIYISIKENETMNSHTIYKLPLFGSNKILIPYDYMKTEENLYLKIICYKDIKCNEEIIINIYNKIIIKEGETLYINGYKENYIYDFIYKYKNNDDEGNIYKQISVYSYQKNDFEFKLKKHKNIIKTENILNGFLYKIKKNENKDCEFDLEVKIRKQSAYIMIQIISIDNNKEYNDIDLMRPIIGILENDNEKKCFYINEKYNEENFIDFMIEDVTQSLIFEYDNIIKNVTFSQTIKYKSSEGKFCIKKLYPTIKHISFYFTVYIPDTNDLYSTYDSHSFIRNKSFLGLLYNGYLYKKIIKESDVKNNYYPSEYNGNILYFYLYIIRGNVKVSNFITNNFPFGDDQNGNNDNFFELLTINSIGNEYFGKILIKNLNKMNSSPMDAHKNIFQVNCQFGVTFSDEITNYCEYNIIVYTENDLIRLRINEKFSYLNFDKIKLKMVVPHYMNKNKLIIDLYTHFGFSYINILNNNNSSINSFYNGYLISNEIMFNNENDKIKNEINIINYYFEVISYDYDYVSLSINGNIYDNDKDLFETRFWFNDYILTTLTESVPKKKIVIDHIPKVSTDLNLFTTIIFLKYLNCEVNTNIIDTQNNSKYFTSVFQDIIDNNHLIVYGKDLSESKNRIEFQIDLVKLYNNEEVCMIYFSSFLIEDYSYSTIYPVLIKENTDTPILFTNKQNYSIILEYIILNYNSPIIISISFEEMTEIYLSCRINTNLIEEKHLYYSQNIIIYENEIKKNCGGENEDNNNIRLCKLNIDIFRKVPSQYESQFLLKNVLLTLNIKSNYEKHVSYLNSNTLTDGIILGEQFQYYYTNIRENDSGSIVLNNKKGLGLMYARIINKNTIDKNNRDWNGRIHLLNRDEIENCEDCLIYDINTNEIIILEKYTKNCNSDLGCQIIIGVGNIENKNKDNINEYNVYEYSIYFLKNNIQKGIYGNLKIQSNKYIQGELNERNKIILDYFLPQYTENIKYELQCKYCSLNLIANDSRIKQDNEEESNIIKYGSKIIKFGKIDEIKLYYNKKISFEILLDKKKNKKKKNIIHIIHFILKYL